MDAFSWEELGEAGEQKIVAAIPKDFAYSRNLLICWNARPQGNDEERIFGDMGKMS